MGTASDTAPITTSHFGVVRDEFLDVVGASPRLEFVITTDAHEGPVYAVAEDALYFTSLPRPANGAESGGPVVSIRRLQLNGERFPRRADDLSTVVARSNVANGMVLDADDRLVVCEQGDLSTRAAISTIDPTTGERGVLVDGWRGCELNSPNDVAISSRDGSIWFTDPSYGSLQGFRPGPVLGDFVYRFDPHQGQVDLVADGFDKPNGIAFSPGGDVLYVTDSGANQTPGSYHVDRPHHVVAYDVVGARLAGRRLFAVTSPGIPDGLKVDACGRVYVSSAAGVLVYDADARLLGVIRVPGAVNFTFGGSGHNVLFITADTGIWAAVLTTKGA